MVLVVLEFDCNSELTLNKSGDERVGYFVRDEGNECSILDRERLGGWSCFQNREESGKEIFDFVVIVRGLKPLMQTLRGLSEELTERSLSTIYEILIPIRWLAVPIFDLIKYVAPFG